MVASNGDTSAIKIRFYGADFADYLGVCDFFAVIGRNGIVVDGKEGIGAVYAFAGGVRVGADTLAEMAQLIRVRFVPNLMKLGVLVELALL